MWSPTRTSAFFFFFFDALTIHGVTGNLAALSFCAPESPKAASRPVSCTTRRVGPSHVDSLSRPDRTGAAGFVDTLSRMTNVFAPLPVGHCWAGSWEVCFIRVQGFFFFIAPMSTLAVKTLQGYSCSW